jgi:hypothetical protein
VTKYEISQDKLNQQFINPDFTITPTDRYPEWLGRRAEILAEEGNSFLADLRAPLET